MVACLFLKASRRPKYSGGRAEKSWSSMETGGCSKALGRGLRHLVLQFLPQSSRYHIDQDGSGYVGIARGMLG